MTTITDDDDAPHIPDEAVLFDLPGDHPAPEPDRPPRPDVAGCAAAVVYQAGMLTFRDVLDCGPGVAAAIDQLATALHRPGKEVGLIASAMALRAVVAETEPHRARLDAAPPRNIADAKHEMYPRGDELAPVVRYTHADRRMTLLASVDLMGWHLDLPDER